MDGSVLVLAAPNPASGTLPPSGRLDALAATALGRGMALILDRTLADCCYAPGASGDIDPSLGARVLTVGSCSVSHGLGGWRAGWFSAPAEHLAAMRELKQAMSICTSAVSQFAALAALSGPGDWLDARRAALVARRDWALTTLVQGGIDAMAPDAWPALLLDARLIDPDDRAATALIARDAGVCVEPGSAWGPPAAGFVRLRLDVPEATLLAAVERLVSFHNVCR